MYIYIYIYMYTYRIRNMKENLLAALGGKFLRRDRVAEHHPLPVEPTCPVPPPHLPPRLKKGEIHKRDIHERDLQKEKRKSLLDSYYL